jgi:HAE1 family hydrophobic/amphiphilic exporter-1
MHAGRKRFRPILLTTLALIDGMLPVAIDIDEGGGFYRPMAVAIIGGTITSTFLTQLIVPDGIELARDHALAKFHRRTPRFTVAGAFVLTLVEAVLALVMVRFVFRLVVKLGRFATGRRAVVTPAAQG